MTSAKRTAIQQEARTRAEMAWTVAGKLVYGPAAAGSRSRGGCSTWAPTRSRPGSFAVLTSMENKSRSGRYFTNSNAFVGQDLNDLAKTRAFQPNEFWIVWPDWTKKYPTDMPGDGSGMDEEGWREATEEEFLKLDADPDAVMDVIYTTQSEKDYKPGEPLAETFGLQEAE